MINKIFVFIYLDGQNPIPCGVLEAAHHKNSAAKPHIAWEGAQFRYARRYVQNPQAVSLDPVALPLGPHTQVFATPLGLPVHNCFRDTLPDQWGRFLMTKMAGRPLSELELLLATSDLRIGNLAYSLTDTEQPQRSAPWETPTENIFVKSNHWDLEYLQKAAENIAGENPNHHFIKQLVNRGSSLGGSRPKYCDLAAWLRKYGHQPDQDCLELFKRMVFNILCNNTDDHLRNHGFLRQKEGRYTLSPLYDVLPSKEVGRHRKLLLKVGAFGRDATLANALSQCENFGLNKQKALATICDMQNAVKTWQDFYTDMGVSKHDIDYFDSTQTFMACGEIL